MEMNDRRINQIKRDYSRATFYVEQMKFSDSKFLKYYYGIQAVVFGAIIRERYKDLITKFESK